MFNFLNFNEIKLLHIIFAVSIAVLGYWIAKLTAKQTSKVVEKIMSKHEAMICRRLVFYAAMLLFLIAALQQLGFNLGVLLGAAGIFTVGIGFAAQTSVANLISGLFLLIERPFKVGDTIIAKGFTGVVESVDLLSTRLSTLDNTLVRIPNENIMQAEIVNLSYFPKRRVDLILSIEYGVSFEKVQKALLEVAQKEELALKDPEPTIIISNFGASAIEIRFSVWGLTIYYTNLRNSLQESIKTIFEEKGINMPFPQMMVHAKLDTASNSA